MNPRHPLGEVLRKDGRFGLRYVRVLSHGPERVWTALTSSEDLRHWLPVDIVGPRAEGAPIELVFWASVVEKYGIEEPSLPGRIVTWQPPTVLSWTWDTDLLTFELEPTDSGTRLTFTTWIGQTPGVDKTAAGYQVCLDQLVTLVDTGSAPPFIEQDPTEYEELYADLIPQEG